MPNASFPGDDPLFSLPPNMVYANAPMPIVPNAGPVPSHVMVNPFADNPMAQFPGGMSAGPVRTDSIDPSGIPMFPPSMPSPEPMPMAAPNVTTPSYVWNPNMQSDADAAAFLAQPNPGQPQQPPGMPSPTPPAGGGGATQTPASSVAASDTSTAQPPPKSKITGNLEQQGEQNIYAGLRKEKAGVEREQQIITAGGEEAFKAAEQQLAFARKRATIEEAATKAQQDELAAVGQHLQTYTDDLLSKRVDPYRLYKNSGILIGIGAMIADSVNVGVDTVLGTSSKSHWDQYQKMIEADTESQFKDIEEGRANVNAGAQMLAQRQAVYKNDQMARHEMNAVKWEMAVQEVKDIRQRTTDEVEGAKLDKVIGDLQVQGGKYQRDFYKDAQAEAARKAAAAGAAAAKEWEHKMEMLKFNEQARHNVATEEGDAAKALLAAKGKGAEEFKYMIPVPGKPDTFLKASSGEQQNQVEKKLTAIDETDKLVDEAKQLLSSRGAGTYTRDLAAAAGKAAPGYLYPTVAGPLLKGAELIGPSSTKTRLDQIETLLTIGKNQGSGLGALDKGTQELLSKYIPDLSSTNPADIERALKNLDDLKRDLKESRTSTVQGVGGGEYQRGAGGFTEVGSTGTAGLGSVPPDFKAR